MCATPQLLQSQFPQLFREMLQFRNSNFFHLSATESGTAAIFQACLKNIFSSAMSQIFQNENYSISKTFEQCENKN
jgi:hypothetical protein